MCIDENLAKQIVKRKIFKLQAVLNAILCINKEFAVKNSGMMILVWP